jgi:hypothetical protein
MKVGRQHLCNKNQHIEGQRSKREREREREHMVNNGRHCQQPENCENRNDPELIQAFVKKWWVESDFKAPKLPHSLRFKGSGCHHNSI